VKIPAIQIQDVVGLHAIVILGLAMVVEAPVILIKYILQGLVLLLAVILKASVNTVHHVLIHVLV